jgi:predicted nucleic acid-binding protein
MINKINLHEPIFVDTWGWIALGYQRDKHHIEVERIFQELRHHNALIYTSDYVLDELITLIFRRENFNESTQFINGILTAIALGHVLVDRITSERFMSAWELRKRFKDKLDISFTDITSMVIMRENNIHQVLTMDEHFAKVGLDFSLIS